MPLNSGLPGPFNLTRAAVAANYKGVGAGAYVLGKLNDLGGITVSYVGRSDEDLIARLGQHADAGKYTHFKAGFVDTEVQAYHRECALFHMFGGCEKLDNEIHPRCPTNKPLRCAHPNCGS